MSNLTPRIDRIERSAFGSEIEVGKISVPHTTITNEQGQPRQISDIANNMKVSMGVERLIARVPKLIHNESGPNGEPVYSLESGDERVRFVGEGWQSISGSNGTNIVQNTTTDYVEVTFYGTGLNMLTLVDQVTRDFRVSVDGGPEGSNIYTVGSGVINSRNVSHNQVLPVVSGLSLDIHTVKIRGNFTISWNIWCGGFEILNESTQLVVNPGKPRFNQKAQEITSQQLVDYNSGFDAQSDTLGSKGGRVLVYQAADGSIGKRLTATDPQVTEGDPTELITNGTFDTDLSSWTVINNVTWISGTADLRHNTTSGVAYLQQTITTNIGDKYTINFDITEINNGTGQALRLDVFETDGVTPVISPVTFDTIGSKTITFEATTSTTVISFRTNTSSAGNLGGGKIDNVSVKQTAYSFLALTDTDHSKEEIIRTVNFREFGSRRSDDFSTLSTTTSDRFFTLDDGTTTLVGDQVQATTPTGTGGGGAGVIMLTNGTIAITFVGTGLDIKCATSAGFTSVDQHDFIVDANSVGSITGTEYGFTSGNSYKTIKVCSGLPYGTHTVRISRTTAVGSGLWVRDFIVYGPKKPELANDELELAEYNIMADFNSSNLISTNNTLGNLEVANGCLWKSAMREFLYNGTWSVSAVFPNYARTGINTNTVTNGSYYEYAFFGTGCVIHNTDSSAGTYTFTVEIDGALNDTGDAIIRSSNDGGGTYTSTSTSGGGNPCKVIFKNLPLGFHTIKVTKTGGAGTMGFTGIDIITPIHINDSSFKIGSLAIKDLRKAVDLVDESKNKVDLSKAKAWAYFDPITGIVKSSYNISSYLYTAGSNHYLYFKQPMKDTNYVVQIWGSGRATNPSSNYILGHSLDQGFYTNYIWFNWVAINNGGSVSVTPADTRNLTIVIYGELQDEENIDLEDL